MKSTKRKPFDALFTGLELVNDSSGTPLNTVLYGKRGEPSVVFSVMNPVQQMKADPEGLFFITRFFPILCRLLVRVMPYKNKMCFVVSHIGMKYPIMLNS